jgi:hypothetical protein
MWPLPLSVKERWYRKSAADVTRPSTQEVEHPERPATLRCARCGQAIASDGDRIGVHGLHEHSQVNPHGYIWNFGCFSSAPGCVAQGERSTEFAWFPNTSWQIQICGGCALHLGWLFEGPSRRFYGLILERLVEDDGD